MKETELVIMGKKYNFLEKNENIKFEVENNVTNEDILK